MELLTEYAFLLAAIISFLLMYLSPIKSGAFEQTKIVDPHDQDRVEFVSGKITIEEFEKRVEKRMET